ASAGSTRAAGVAMMVTGRNTVRRRESRAALSARAGDGEGGCWAAAPNEKPTRIVQATAASAAARESGDMTAPKMTERGRRHRRSVRHPRRPNGVAGRVNRRSLAGREREEARPG